MSSRAAPSLSYAARREVIERMAPRYQQVSPAQKTLLLDTVVAATGYARKYAIGLLNQVPAGKRTIERRRLPRYGPQILQALLEAWKAAKHICAKRLIPFLPTLVAALERHGHLQLTSENRSLLLSMSVTTAERRLRPHRKQAPARSTITQAGPLLKDQIPLRTFQQWDESQPGFLEADLVGHHGGDTQSCFLYTLTLTDIATGWTECFPLLYKSPEAVLAALQHARVLFPFPIVGLDVDNGAEFINEALLAYCAAEHITFTRGREGLKADQCFVEQKNGAVVRQFVGHERLVGLQAYRQLRELYRAVRLYVNCFQPSMKLLSKCCEEEHVRREYDPAKTPFQRLLLSAILPVCRQQELSAVAEALDPLSLLQQVEYLQQALRRSAGTTLPLQSSEAATCIQPFCVQRCLPGTPPCSEKGVKGTSTRATRPGEPPSETHLLDWPRTTKDPFEGQWERILCLVLTHPEWSGSDLFEEMQRLFPGRYRPSQLGTFQCGLRKIRARLLAIMEEPWPQEVIQGGLPTSISAGSGQREQEADGKTEACHASSTFPTTLSSQQTVGARSVQPERPTEEAISSEAGHGLSAPQQDGELPDAELGQANSPLDASLAQGNEQPVHQTPLPALSIERAIESYVQEHREARRSPKTIEWHQTALGLLQQYLVSERHLRLLWQITESEVRGWIASLRTTPSIKDTRRSTATIATYARSARAFCHWLVRKGHLERAPFVKGLIPKARRKTIHLTEMDEFERLLLACRAAGESDTSRDRTAARNRAILWVLLDTGMSTSQLCGLRLCDVDREHRALRIASRRRQERWLALSSNGWYQLLSYLEQHRPKQGSAEKSVGEESLFLSETYQPLTVNAITLLFHRLNQRAGITKHRVSPSVLRDTFAVRYLQTGGELEPLRDLLGLTSVAALRRYKRLSEEKCEPQAQTEPVEEHQRSPQPAQQTNRRRQRKAPSAANKIRRQRAGGRSDGSAGKESISDEGEGQ